MKKAPLLIMSKQELNRVELMVRIQERRLTQRQAAEMLELSVRQVERLFHGFKKSGPAGLVSRKRGRPSNRRLPEKTRKQALELVRGLYPDFGPTLAHEKLEELHGIEVSVETLRCWMIADGIWEPRSQRLARVHQPRPRRACFGELVQIDGSDHNWFEDRGDRLVLLVFIDDATGRLNELRFCLSETTFDYFLCARTYLQRYGKPVAFYSDKASIFRVNHKQAESGDGYTQFGRAMSDLNIDIICANSAPAKGRVERANKTLQDRLVKELRLRGISSIDAANEFLPEFMQDYNRRFERVPRSDHDAHRPLMPYDNLDDVFTWQEERKVSKSLTLNYKRTLYALEPSDAARDARGQRVTVFEYDDGSVCIRHGNLVLPARAFPKDNPRIEQGAIIENKLLSGALKHIQAKQLERDRTRLASKKLTKREKERLREEQDQDKKQRIRTPKPDRPGSTAPTFLLGREPDICTLD
jgi:transposase